MTMTTESRFWQIIIILVGLVPVFVPFYIYYDLYERGDIPEKKIELSKISFTDPLSDLSGFGGKVSLKIHSQTESLDNIVIAESYLKNAGRTPVVPADYCERISVNVNNPWKILAVVSYDDVYGIEFKWNKVSDNRFEAVPALLNPGDIIGTKVYLTNNEHEILTSPEKRAKPNVEWKARILNLTTFTDPPDIFSLFGKHSWGITVDLSGWALLVTLGGAMLFLALYLHLLSRASFLEGMGVTAILKVLGASFLSLAAAKSMAVYLFRPGWTVLFGVNHWVNAPWIILHVIFFGFLCIKVRHSYTSVYDR